MSRFFAKQPRADARRNARRILDAAAELIAADPEVSMERIAARAGVSRVTLYNRFSTRHALMDALTERSVAEVAAALEGARPEDGPAHDALERLLRAAWPLIGRYRGLVLVNRRLDRADLRARLEPALAPLRALIRQGQRSGEFDPNLPSEWLLAVLVDLIHQASAQVTAGAMDTADAERALLRTATAVLASHR